MEKYDLTSFNITDPNSEDREIIIENLTKCKNIIEESERFVGVVETMSESPCSMLIYDKNIEEEIGLILCKSESTKNEVLVAILESSQIDRFGWLKNDFLTVSVIGNNQKVYDRIGINPFTIDELIKLTDKYNKLYK